MLLINRQSVTVEWRETALVTMATEEGRKAALEAGFSVSDEEMKKWMSRAFEMVSLRYLTVKIAKFIWYSITKKDS